MISGLCIFFPAEAPRHMLCVARKSRVSHFSQRPKFSKARGLRKWHVLPQAAEHITCAGGGCTATLQRNICSTAQAFVFALSAAAVLLACQLCSLGSTGQQKREAESKRAERASIAWKQHSLQRAFHSEEVSSPGPNHTIRTTDTTDTTSIPHTCDGPHSLTISTRSPQLSIQRPLGLFQCPLGHGTSCISDPHAPSYRPPTPRPLQQPGPPSRPRSA